MNSILETFIYHFNRPYLETPKLNSTSQWYSSLITFYSGSILTGLFRTKNEQASFQLDN